MKEKPFHTSDRRKSLTIVTVAYAAFTAISIIGPILLERRWAKNRREQQK